MITSALCSPVDLRTRINADGSVLKQCSASASAVSGQLHCENPVHNLITYMICFGTVQHAVQANYSDLLNSYTVQHAVQANRCISHKAHPTQMHRL